MKSLTQETIVWLWQLHRLEQDGVPIPRHIPFTAFSSAELERMAIHAYRTNQTWKGDVKIEKNLHEWIQLSSSDAPKSFYLKEWSILPGGEWLAGVELSASDEVKLHLCYGNHRGLVVSLQSLVPILQNNEGEDPPQVEVDMTLHTRWRSSGTEIVAALVSGVDCGDV